MDLITNGLRNTTKTRRDHVVAVTQHITTFSRNLLKMGKSSPEHAGLTGARKYIAIKNNTRQTRQSGTKKSAVSMDKVAKRWGGSSFTVHRQVKALLTTGSPRVNLHAGRPTALTHGEEDALIAYCIFLQKGNFPALIEMVMRTFVHVLCGGGVLVIIN